MLLGLLALLRIAKTCLLVILTVRRNSKLREQQGQIWDQALRFQGQKSEHS